MAASNADARRLPLRRGALHRGAEGSRGRRLPLQHVPQVDGGAVHRSMDCDDTVKVEDDSQPRRLSFLGMGRALLLQEVRHARCSTGWSARDCYDVSAEAFDDRAGYAFTSQIFIDEKPAYYDFANKTHNMTGAEVFAAFAPPDAGQAKG